MTRIHRHEIINGPSPNLLADYIPGQNRFTIVSRQPGDFETIEVVFDVATARHIHEYLKDFLGVSEFNTPANPPSVFISTATGRFTSGRDSASTNTRSSRTRIEGQWTPPAWTEVGSSDSVSTPAEY